MNYNKYNGDIIVNQDNEIRINKYLSMAGVCARREADRLIAEGLVKVDGETATLGTKVKDKQVVTVKGKVVSMKQTPVVLAFNKPVGITSTMAKDDPDSIENHLNYEERVYPVGRLDKDSEGLILLTNDGDLMNRILKASNGHEKEYIVRVNKKVNKNFVTAMQEGVPITNGNTGKKVITAPCKVEKIDDYTFKIVLIQGLNRQIRRMCGYLGYNVLNLKRIRIINVKLGNLKPGCIRKITGEELEVLYAHANMR